MNEFSEDLNTEREIKWRKALIQKDGVKKEHEEKDKATIDRAETKEALKNELMHTK